MPAHNSPPAEPPPPARSAAAPVSQSALLGWLLPPLLLSSAGLGIWLVFNTPDHFFVWVAGFLVALGALWIFISTLFPRTAADRTCPACGKDTLVRTDLSTTHGLSCKSCLWQDGSLSSFFIAEEEETPIERTIFAKRQRRLAKSDTAILQTQATILPAQATTEQP